MKRDAFRFRDGRRVRWAEIGAQKGVFDGHGLMYFDTAIRRLPAPLALPSVPTIDALSAELQVRKASPE